MKSKLHRCVATDANLHYEGSISIDSNLMEMADLQEFEKVGVVNINNGARFETYVIKAPAKSGEICINGAAARLVQKGDMLIIFSYCMITEEELASHKPKLVLMGPDNVPQDS